MIIEEQRLCGPLAFVVAGARPRRVHMAHIALRLRMHFRVAVYFAGGCLQNARALFSGKLEHVVGAKYAGPHRTDRVVLIVRRRSRAGEIEDALHRTGDLERLRDVVLDERKSGMVEKRPDVLDTARVEIVDAGHVVTALHQPIAEMRTDESGAAGDHGVHAQRRHGEFVVSEPAQHSFLTFYATTAVAVSDGTLRVSWQYLSRSRARCSGV